MFTTLTCFHRSPSADHRDRLWHPGPSRGPGRTAGLTVTRATSLPVRRPEAIVIETSHGTTARARPGSRLLGGIAPVLLGGAQHPEVTSAANFDPLAHGLGAGRWQDRLPDRVSQCLQIVGLVLAGVLGFHR